MEELRNDLLRTLGVGEWEAEGLTLLDLTRRLIELCDWQAERLQAQSHECASRACDIQELLSGEAWDRQREELFHLGEEVAELAKENATLRDALAVRNSYREDHE